MRTSTNFNFSRDQMKQVLVELDLKKIKEDVFGLFGIIATQKDVINAYYSFMIDQALV